MKFRPEPTKQYAKKHTEDVNKAQNLTKDIANFSKRIREIGIKKSSLSGIININQVTSPIQFESSLERDYIFLLEFDVNVKQYLEQPIAIKYLDENKKGRRYIPDFIVEYHDERPSELIEIKYTSTLISKKIELECKFTAAREYCRKNNLSFKIIDELHIRKDREIELNNFKFLDRYRNYFFNINKDNSAFPIVNESLLLLRGKLKELQKCTITELICSCTQDIDKQAELIFLTWWMVSNLFVEIDLKQKLTLNSIICLT